MRFLRFDAMVGDEEETGAQDGEGGGMKEERGQVCESEFVVSIRMDVFGLGGSGKLAQGAASSHALMSLPVCHLHLAVICPSFEPILEKPRTIGTVLRVIFFGPESALDTPDGRR